MLKFYYESANGEVVDFHGSNVWSDPAWMRSYKWDIKSSGGRFSSVRRKEQTWKLEAYFFGDDPTECKKARNAAYKIFDADVAGQTPGRLYVGDYYLTCYIYGITNPEAALGIKKIRCQLDIVASDPVWVKEINLVFASGGGHSSGGYDFPHNFDYDYGTVGHTKITNVGTGPADFTMTIYGPCEDPEVVIDGHVYKVFGTIAEGNMVVIDSREKTVRLVAQDRSWLNWFSRRYREESIFEPIRTGVKSASWLPQSAVWQIVVYEQRSEPPFEEE